MTHRILAIGVGSVLAVAEMATASFTSTHVDVQHLISNANPVTIIDTNAPPATINTVDRDNGATATLFGPTLTLKTQTSQITNPAGGPLPVAPFTNTGKILFDASEPFTLTTGTPFFHVMHDARIALQNLSTGQQWRYGALEAPSAATIISDLPTPAPSGSYELSWTHTSLQFQSQVGRGTLEVTLTSVPEPTSLGTLTLGSLVGRRRR